MDQESLSGPRAGDPEQARDGVDFRAGFISLATATWRLAQLFERVFEKIDPVDAKRLESQYRFVEQRIDDALALGGLKVVDPAGQHHDPGMAVTALNAGEFDPDHDLVVRQTIEPIVLGRDGALKFGVVILGRAH